MWNQDGGPSCHTEHPAWGWILGSGLPASAALKEERKRQEGLRHPIPPVPTQQRDSRGEPAAPPITAAPTRKAPRGTGRCGHSPKAKSGHSHGPAGTLSEVYYTKVRTRETGFDLLFTVAEERFGSLPSLPAQCRAAGASRGLTAISPSTPSFLIFPNRHSTPTEHSRPSLLSPWHLPLCLHHSAW